MNTQNSSTIRQTWHKFYRISRLGKASPRNLITLLSDDCAKIYLFALQSVMMRDGYHTALMARRIPDTQAGRWLVPARCARYGSHSGRLPA